jgi:hypothetical protein
MNTSHDVALPRSREHLLSNLKPFFVANLAFDLHKARDCIVRSPLKGENTGKGPTNLLMNVEPEWECPCWLSTLSSHISPTSYCAASTDNSKPSTGLLLKKTSIINKSLMVGQRCTA